jgi:hypothetical protein
MGSHRSQGVGLDEASLGGLDWDSGDQCLLGKWNQRTSQRYESRGLLPLHVFPLLLTRVKLSLALVLIGR